MKADVDGVPLRISLSGGWQDVTLARKPWRLDQHWWRGEHILRDYFRLSPQDGPPLTVYHDLVSDSWFRQEY